MSHRNEVTPYVDVNYLSAHSVVLDMPSPGQAVTLTGLPANEVVTRLCTSTQGLSYIEITSTPEQSGKAGIYLFQSENKSINDSFLRIAVLMGNKSPHSDTMAVPLIADKIALGINLTRLMFYPPKQLFRFPEELGGISPEIIQETLLSNKVDFDERARLLEHWDLIYKEILRQTVPNPYEDITKHTLQELAALRNLWKTPSELIEY